MSEHSRRLRVMKDLAFLMSPNLAHIRVTSVFVVAARAAGEGCHFPLVFFNLQVFSFV